jgi:ACS family glucarate transporter-like MFS transporter
MHEPTTVESADPSRRPTHLRHYIVGATAVMSVLLYLDRFCVSFAETYIQDELGLTDTQIGLFLAVFFLTYALAQVPSGWLTDRYGARLTLAVYIVVWSLFTGLTGAAFGLVALLAARGAIGVAQAGAFPAGANLISKWVPFRERATASSLVAVGGRLGGAIAPLLTAFLLVALVPVGSSSRFTESQVFDASRLAYLIRYGSQFESVLKSGGGDLASDPGWPQRPGPEDAAADNPAFRLGERLYEGFGTEHRAGIDDVARAHARNVAARHRGGEGSAQAQAPAGAPPSPDGATAEFRTALAAALNSAVARRDLVAASDVPLLSLPREAASLSRRERESLTDAEVERLNRLYIEAAYPRTIQRLYGTAWRPVMVIYGVAGLVVAAFFWYVSRDEPSAHPLCNAEEQAIIAAGRPATTPSSIGKSQSVPWRGLLTSPGMWLMCVSAFFTNVGWIVVMTYLPRYLDQVHRVPIEQRGWMTFIPAAVGWFGLVLGGRVTDGLTQRIGIRWGRALPLAASRFVAMSAYFILILEPSPWVAVAAFSIVAFSTDFGISPVWAYCQDVGGRSVAAAIGWPNMWGNLGACITLTLLLVIVGKDQNWTAAFMTCAGAFFLAGVTALGINAARPIVRQDEES